MSWSRIIELSSEPIEKEDYIDESTFFDYLGEHSLFECFEDVSESRREVELGNVLSRITGISHDKEEGILTVVDKEAYLAQMYDDYIKQVKALDVPKEQFVTAKTKDGEKLDTHLYLLNKLWSDEYGVYFYFSESGTMETVSEFMRNAMAGEKWHVGGVVFYKY